MFLREPNVNCLKLYGIICLNVARPRFFKERKYQFYKIRFIYLEKFSEKSNTEGGCLTYLAQETTSQWEQNKFTVKKSGTRPCPMQISDLAIVEKIKAFFLAKKNLRVHSNSRSKRTPCSRPSQNIRRKKAWCYHLEDKQKIGYIMFLS